MAEPKRMQLVASQPLGGGARRLEFECSVPLAYRGGQFLIVDTGLVQEDGKAVKRCFSILSAEGERDRIELAIQRVGPGTEALAQMELGTEVLFSGPWGKLGPNEDTPLAPGLVVATDTGITGALGLLGSQAMTRLLPGMHFLWLHPSEGGLLSGEEVERRLPQGLAGFHSAEIAPVNSGQRVELARAALAAIPALDLGENSTVWLLGDGHVIEPLLGELREQHPALNDERILPEYYFHNPKRR